jgi:hypothetical protein
MNEPASRRIGRRAEAMRMVYNTVASFGSGEKRKEKKKKKVGSSN